MMSPETEIQLKTLRKFVDLFPLIPDEERTVEGAWRLSKALVMQELSTSLKETSDD